MRPLAGITVVSLEQAVAAPFATRQLADLGARVIKVERPGSGDFARAYDRTVNGQSSYFVWLNRSKESIELDLKDPADRAVLDTMIERADVFVQNLIPGAVERLGLGATALRSRMPRLVHLSISGYGSSGPLREKKAYDALVQAEAGLIAATGTPESPVKVGVSIADIATGMYAYTGILTALYERERTGRGSDLEVAMIDALGEWMAQPAYYSAYGDKPWARTGARHGTIAPYGPYRCAGAEEIFLAVQNDREWQALSHEVLHDPELAKDPRFSHNPARVENNSLITGLLEQSFKDLRADEVAALLDRVGIANAQMRTPAALFDHPQLRSRGRWTDIGSPGGPIRALLPPVDIDGHEPVMGPVPALGSHNESLRREFAATRDRT